MDIWIGTSGYSYPDWVDDFYPADLPPKRMLNYYATQFPLVELNFTFYRPPTPEMLARLADQVPSGFRFAVKLPRTISHEQSTADIAGFRLAVEQMRQRDCLLGILCQLPQATHNTHDARQWVEHLADKFGDLGLAVEFRHRSWAHQEVPAWLGELGVDLVAVDAPNLPGIYPSGWVQSSSTVYVRLHSRNADKWYADGADRYDYDYSDNEMSEWVDATRSHAGFTDRVMLLFNNCSRSQAAVNARRMRDLFSSATTGVNVVTPFAPAPPVQGLLFN
jgi:uncharacterized protein YecE (DUF72 family)